MAKISSLKLNTIKGANFLFCIILKNVNLLLSVIIWFLTAHFSSIFLLSLFLAYIAALFATGALFLPVPWCFLTLIPSNVLGEIWIGVASAMIVDLTPTIIRTSSIALYLFIITIIGWNFNILVPYLTKAFKLHLHGSDKAVGLNSIPPMGSVPDLSRPVCGHFYLVHLCIPSDED